MNEPPTAAMELLLDLVRPQIEAGTCAHCGAEMRGCRIGLDVVEPDRIEATATCGGCGATRALLLRPSSDGGAASVR